MWHLTVTECVRYPGWNTACVESLHDSCTNKGTGKTKKNLLFCPRVFTAWIFFQQVNCLYAEWSINKFTGSHQLFSRINYTFRYICWQCNEPYFAPNCFIRPSIIYTIVLNQWDARSRVSRRLLLKGIAFRTPAPRSSFSSVTLRPIFGLQSLQSYCFAFQHRMWSKSTACLQTASSCLPPDFPTVLLPPKYLLFLGDSSITHPLYMAKPL